MIVNEVLLTIGIFILLALFIVLITCRRLYNQLKQDEARHIDSAYTKPNQKSYSGEWQWPKSPDI
jgi:hypothetical protein